MNTNIGEKNISISRYLGRQGIGKTLLLWIIFFSSLITLSLSAIQLLIDYKVEIGTINNRLDEIESSYKSVVEASLWNVDRDQLNIQLEGIVRLPDIQAVYVEETINVGSAISLKKGESKGSSVKRDYELVHYDGEEAFVIGHLYVEASLTAVYQRLLNKALTIMVVQGIKTFFVSFFILFVFYRLVTRHIIDMEQFLKNVDVRYSLDEIKLARKPSESDDELDHLVVAYNSMIADLRRAYNDMRVVNEQLKKDIAARKTAEAKVKLLNEELEARVQVRTAELEAANKELNTFCYSVSHDLRAPLRRINGFRHNVDMEFGSKLGVRGKHYLSRMESCTNEMNAMIDSFLTLAKSTNTELVIEEVNLSATVERMLTLHQEKDPNRKVRMKIQANVRADCDIRLVELLLNNLLDNAWKYSSKKEGAMISFSHKKVRGERIFIIEDNGAGFNMDYAENLFTPFTRLHKVSDFRGIGIGLATVKRVAARHGGRVWAESEVGKGAKFFFTLKAKGALEFTK